MECVAPDDTEGTMRWVAVFLAADYGTCLQRDFEAEAAAGRHQMGDLSGQPKALLPCGGGPILDHWLWLFRHKCRGAVDEVLIVTNDVFFPSLRCRPRLKSLLAHQLMLQAALSACAAPASSVSLLLLAAGADTVSGTMLLIDAPSTTAGPSSSRWARQRGIDQSRVLSNGTAENSTRKGACADLALILEQRADVVQDRHILVVASNLLFTADFDVHAFLFKTAARAPAACLFYSAPDEDMSKRDILEVEAETMRVTRFLEKPALSETVSHHHHHACPPLYSLHPCVARLLGDFLDAHRKSGAAPAKVLAEIDASTDAPGKFISWLVGRGDVRVVAHPVTGHFEIATAAQYQEAFNYFAAQQQRALDRGLLPEQVCCTCLARIGLAGNPSDGFGGKVLATTILNFQASVSIVAASPAEGNAVVIQPHKVLDGILHPGGFEQLVHEVEVFGYYGAARLIRAACKKFGTLVRAAPLPHMARRGCVISYDTNIPRSVGLSGSAALIIATLKALLKFHAISLQDLGLSQAMLPKIALAVEEEELGISAGPMDRLVQCSGGLLLMDFAADMLQPPYYCGLATRLAPSLLPPLYLAYNINCGGESGRVHAPVRQRFAAGDEHVVERMRLLRELAVEAAQALERRDFGVFASVIRRNFALRREIYGDAALGLDNVRAFEALKTLGLAAKFAGSGGAFVCVVPTAPWVLEHAQERAVSERLESIGFRFVRVLLPVDSSEWEDKAVEGGTALHTET
jgi:glucuronokinase